MIQGAVVQLPDWAMEVAEAAVVLLVAVWRLVLRVYLLDRVA